MVRSFKRYLFIAILVLMLFSILSIHATGKVLYRTIEDKIEAEGAANVIIIEPAYKHQDGIHMGVAAASRKDAVASASSVLSNRKDLKIIHGYAGRLTREGLEKIRSSGARIYEDGSFKIQALDGNRMDGNNDPAAMLDISTRAVGANYSWDVLNITGRNVTVAVIDTGISYTHPDLGGCFGPGCRVRDGYDFWNDDADPADDFGHGTHVAGIIGANGTVNGVAPGTQFFALKACDSEGTCDFSLIIEAIDWAVSHNASIISMSIGGSYSSDVDGNSGEDAVSIAVDQAVAAGIPVVIAAGNYGPAPGTITVPGSAKSAITVCAANDRNTVAQSDDTIASFSGRGPGAFGRLDPDICAPGYGIYSTFYNSSMGNSYYTWSGTSMATPHVAGIIALMLEQNRSLTPAVIRARLTESAVPLAGKAFETGTGETNAQNALTTGSYALVRAENSYGASAYTDRWEFVSIPGKPYTANITVFNTNSYNMTFNISVSALENMEDAGTINRTQLSIPSAITVPANSNYTFGANFTLNDNQYASTYAGMILLNGSMDNGTANMTRNLRLPIVITVPFMYYANTTRNVDYSGIFTGEVLSYAYYNNLSSNNTFGIYWSSTDDDLDLYEYYGDGILDDYAGYAYTDFEEVASNQSSTVKWARIHAYNITSPLPYDFSLVIVDDENHAPVIKNITNSSDSISFSYYAGQNITLKVNYSDADNDTLTISINDSRYAVLSNGTGYVTYYLSTNSSHLGNHSVTITLADGRGGFASQSEQLEVYSPILISNYSPSSLSQVIAANQTISFTQDSVDLSGGGLSYAWLVNGVLNSSSQNFTFNTTQYNISQTTSMNITFAANNSFMNNTVNWNVTIDAQPPNVSIASPAPASYNSPNISLNYAASDDVLLSSCWYSINSASNSSLFSNTSLPSCSNTTLYLASSNYALYVYANDSLGHITVSNVSFIINDSASPSISHPLPSGTLAYTATSATLNVTTDENATCRYSTSDIAYAGMTSNFTDNNTMHAATASVSAGNTYHYFVRCMDMTGNTNNVSTQIEFSVASAPASGGDSGGGGGGSSGGGMGSSIPEPSADDTPHGLIFYVSSSGNPPEFNISINDDAYAVTSVDVIVDQGYDSVQIIIENSSIDVNSFAEKSYGSFTLSHPEINESSISAATIRFVVAKPLLDADHISPQEMLLYRYDKGWYALRTSYLGEEDGNYLYSAQSTGLGSFLMAEAIKKPVVENPIRVADDSAAGDSRDAATGMLSSIGNPPNSTNSTRTEARTSYMLYASYGVFALFILCLLGGIVLVIKYSSAKGGNTRTYAGQSSAIRKEYLDKGRRLQKIYLDEFSALHARNAPKEEIESLKDSYKRKIDQLHDDYAELLAEASH